MLDLEKYLPRLISHIEKQITLLPEQIEILSSLLKGRRVLKRQYLLQAETVCQYESFVVEGCLRMFCADDKGTEHTLSFAVENWWLSDLESFLNSTPSWYHVEALENSIVLQLDKPSLEILYQKIPLLDRYFRILHQNAFIAQSKRILQNISLSGEEKYKAFLETYPHWHQRIPQKYIASYLGMTPVFLSQIRKQRSLGEKSN